MNTTQYTFPEWLQLNPANADNDAPCVFCKGTGHGYDALEKKDIDCIYCNGTGKQAVADAYADYLAQALRDAKAIYNYETLEHRREYRDRKMRLQLKIDAMRRAKGGATR